VESEKSLNSPDLAGATNVANATAAMNASAQGGHVGFAG
jgi:hypothetical protein